MPAQPKRVVLASASPRRKEILQSMGVSFDVLPSDVDESKIRSPFARVLVKKLALAKADAVARECKDAVVVSADTMVVKGFCELGKPKDRQDAIDMLCRLNGKWHSVYTGVCVAFDGKKKTFCVRSKVKFKNLSQKEIRDYVDECKPFDKAGAYGIQDERIVEKYKGSYTNVVGLPKEKLAKALLQAGVENGNDRAFNRFGK